MPALSVSVILSLLAGACLAIGVQYSVSINLPNITTVHSIISEKTSNGSTVLTVDSSGGPVKNCLRITQHVIYRDSPNNKRHYVPLATALNGLGFQSVDDFIVTLVVPEDVESGVWTYTSRSAYVCSTWPGLTKMTQSQTNPINVTIQ